MKITFIIFVTLATVASSNIIKPTFLTSDFISSINEKRSTWKAGRNFPEDTPIEELRRLTGSILDPDDDTEIKTSFMAAADIPEYFDSRERWPECQTIREIRNQGRCGSCWAFSTVEAISDRFCIATKGEYFKFSAENVLACCSDCGHGCNGGTPAKAWKYWVTDGIVSGGDYNSQHGCQPYGEEAFKNATTPMCHETCTNTAYSTPYGQDRHFGSSSYRLASDVSAIQEEIMTHGPVETHVDIFQDFYSYKSGVYQHVEGNYTGGHAVKIIGWGHENDTPYWLIANSWGTSWGDLGGFFKILRGSNHCNIERTVNAGIPKI